MTSASDECVDRHLAPLPGTRKPGIAYSMRALGRNLPETLTADGRTWRHVRTIKHDFWAVTGFYQDDRGELAVLKMGRTENFAGLPLQFIGRYLCRREVRFYTRLSDLPNVPPILGLVGRTGFLHAFVSGEPLAKDRPVPDSFFSELVSLMDELHRRNIAYVDANKPQNIILGADQRPHLIDFQISWDLVELSNTWLNRWWLRRLQEADIYHVLKHKKRMRPDQLTEGERYLVEQRSTLTRVHRFVTKPYFKIRRAIFRRLRQSGKLLPEGSK